MPFLEPAIVGINYGIAFFALIFNGMLLYLIRYHSGTEINIEMVYILTNTTVTDLILGLLWAPLQFLLVVKCSEYRYYLTGFISQVFSVEVCKAAFWLLFAPLLYHSILSFPLAFVYRYYSISRMNKPNPFTRNKFLLLLGLLFCFAVALGKCHMKIKYSRLVLQTLF